MDPMSTIWFSKQLYMDIYVYIIYTISGKFILLAHFPLRHFTLPIKKLLRKKYTHNSVKYNLVSKV